jgi:hypothetical protein
VVARQGRGIWSFVLGYFLAYLPYSMLAKGISKGLFSADGRGVDGPVLLPISMTFSVGVLFAFWWLSGWWRDAARARPWPVGRLLLPRPRAGTWLAGLCVAGISASTTLAFTFNGVSIVLAMLLMRGGVLVMAPLVDGLLGREVRPTAWLGFGLTLAAMLLSLAGSSGHHVPWACGLVLGIYLACYFVRFWLMTRLAKTPDRLDNQRFLVEEQMVGNGLLVVWLVAAAAIGGDGMGGQLRRGFGDLWGDPGLVWALLLMGLFSAGTGMFGSLIFLDHRENTFCIPLNRASSLLAGMGASLLMQVIFGTAAPRSAEILGALLVGVAMLVVARPGLRTPTSRA